MSMGLEGGCQCKGIRFRLGCEPIVVYVCHCTDCQKQSSSAFGISVWIPSEEFHLVKGKLNYWVTQGDSGKNKQCAFCPNCGSRIFHLTEDQPDIVSLKGGTLDQARQLQPAGHIWTRSGQAWALPLGKKILQYSTEPESFDELIESYACAGIQRL